MFVGTPVMGRNSEDLLDIIGMFVNTLPLKIHIDEDLSFIDFLNTVKSTFLEAFTHQSYPFDRLVSDLDFKRDTSRNPLFDTTFTYQNDGLIPVSFNGMASKLYVPDVKISKFDFSLEVVPNNNGLDLNFEYCTKLFKKETIERLSGHFINIVQNVITNCEEKLADIDILSEDERNKILYEFNNTKMDFPEDKTILELFEEQVEHSPYSIAVVFEDKHLTYKELNEKANAVAKELLKNNVSYKDVVGIFLPRSIELVIGIWAVLKCGAVYMPMHVDYPDDRINYMVENSGAKLVLTNNSLRNRVDSVSSILLDNFESIDCMPNIKSSNSLPDDVCYIIYTSGSTGRPKGVQITNRCLNNYVHAFTRYFDGISADDNILSAANISFDASIFELFVPLIKGASLILYHHELIKDILDYCDYIVKHKVTSLFIPPNILNEVYSILKDKEGVKISKLFVGAEVIRKDSLDKFFKLNPNMVIINGYGPTETTICASVLVYKKDSSLDFDILPIGSPLYNDHIYILGNNKKPQPIGIPGELYVTGAGVGAGYINNISETNKNYLANIFDSSSEKMYKTGDIGKWNEDGTISFLGRKDNQIKISGYRIELDEIDTVIMSYPNIEKSITIVLDDIGKKRLVSYFTSSKKIDIKDLLTFLNKKLTFYMIPNKLMQLDAFPITPNGKIDKRALPIPTFESEVQYMPPQNATEEKLHSIWADLFNIDKISIYDNFFHIGGDSLSSIKLVSRIYESFNVKLGINQIFNAPTIKSLSEIIDSMATSNVSPSITVQPKRNYYPVSSAQRRIYFANKMAEHSTSYNVLGGLLLDAMPDIIKLQNCLNFVIARHEPLRTYFEIVNRSNCAESFR